MPKNAKPNPGAERIRDRFLTAAATGEGGPFTKHQQKAVVKLRKVIREGLYEKPKRVK